jgi:uncharacterized surface protein with fasciclin (FAS1) repeats
LIKMNKVLLTALIALIVIGIVSAQNDSGGKVARGPVISSKAARGPVEGNLITSPPAQPQQKKNIVDTIEDKSDLDKFGDLIRAADLEQTLSGKGPFTVFAPTDYAFGKLDKLGLNDILGDKNNSAIAVNSHIAEGNLTLLDLKGRRSIKMLQGSLLSIEDANSIGIEIDGIPILSSEIHCTNGIIYMIDKVIIPESLQSILKEEARTADPVESSLPDFQGMNAQVSMPQQNMTS